MYRNNKANLGLRTICITVALLGMLFFTHSQFSSATPPSLIDVQLKTRSGDSSPLDSTEVFLFDVLIILTGSDTIASTDAVTVTYAIGTATGKTVELSINVANPPSYSYTEDVPVKEGDNGVITFTKISFKTSSTGATAIDYTTATTSPKQVDLSVEGGTISAQTPIEDITDVTSVAVGITSSGDDTAVTIGETVTVDVNVGNAMEGVAVVDPDAMKDDATDHKLLYDVGASGTATEVTLLLGDNDTHFTVTLPPVADGDIAGAFTFESVKLSLNNADGDTTAEVKTYTTVDTSILTLTDAGLTIDPSNAVTDVASVKVKISTSGDDSTVTNGETVNVEVTVGNAVEGIAVVDTGAMTGDATAHTLQYDIGASGASAEVTLFLGDNDTHFTGMLTVGAMTPAGAFTFESVTLSLQNGAGNALSPKERTYTTEMDSVIVVTLTDAGLTIDPPEVTAVEVLANATAVDNKAEGGDKVTFTAWITNSTDGLPLNVTVNYKISGTKDVTGSVLLANQGLNETDSATNRWSGTLTLADNVTAGNLTIVSIVVWAKNMDSSLTASMTFTAADAKATNVVKIEVPAPVDPPTDNKTTSASSSESSSDSPVSIFAMFILIASVSMAVGVYTLRRRQ